MAGRCNVTYYFKQAAVQAGESPETVRQRIRRGSKKVGEDDPQKSSLLEKLDSYKAEQYRHPPLTNQDGSRPELMLPAVSRPCCRVIACQKILMNWLHGNNYGRLGRSGRKIKAGSLDGGQLFSTTFPDGVPYGITRTICFITT